MSNRKWREEFVATCARLGVPNALRDRLLREAPAIQRGAEAECSFTEEIAAPFVKRAEAAERRILATVAECNRLNETSFRVECGGDPRGATVRLCFPPATPGCVGAEFGVPGEGFSGRSMEWLEARQNAIWRRGREAAMI